MKEVDVYKLAEEDKTDQTIEEEDRSAPADEEDTIGDWPMLQGPCTLAFTDARTGRASALEGVFLTLSLGESIDTVTRERALALAALVHLDARDSLLLTLADDPNAVHAGDTADRARGL